MLLNSKKYTYSHKTSFLALKSFLSPLRDCHCQVFPSAQDRTNPVAFSLLRDDCVPCGSQKTPPRVPRHTYTRLHTHTHTSHSHGVGLNGSTTVRARNDCWHYFNSLILLLPICSHPTYTLGATTTVSPSWALFVTSAGQSHRLPTAEVKAKAP